MTLYNKSMRSATRGTIGKKTNLPNFRRADALFTSREDILEALGEIGKIPDRLIAIIRIPRNSIRGSSVAHEYFDIFSTQPSTMTEANSPSSCFDRGLAAPAWVQQWYLAIETRGGKDSAKSIIYIHKPRNIFIKKEIKTDADLEALTAELLRHIISR